MSHHHRTAITTLVLGLLTSTSLFAASPLEYIGQQTLPTGFVPSGPAGIVNGIPAQVGGLSGIDFDPATGRYVAISDDRSQFAPARFYGLSLDLTRFASSTPGGVSFTAVTPFLQPNGTPFPALSIDPESIRLRGGSVFWTSEGERNPAVGRVAPPVVREATADGTTVRDFGTPSKYTPVIADPVAGTTDAGIRNNLAFESLTFNASGTRLYAATENALIQDGPAATPTGGSPNRVVAFDTVSGNPVAEYVYVTEPVAQAPNPAGAFSTNGLVELLAVDDTRFLALERSFSTGVGGTGNTIRIYLAELSGATDVLGLESLAGQSYVPMTKTLLLDLDDLGIPLDNVEGMTFGETFNGKRTLILVSDNNFSATQFTQFLAFSITGAIPEPSTYAITTAGLGVLAWLGRRKRAATRR